MLFTSDERGSKEGGGALLHTYAAPLVHPVVNNCAPTCSLLAAYTDRTALAVIFVPPARNGTLKLLIGLLSFGLLVAAAPAPEVLDASVVKADALYTECGLQGQLGADAFRKAYASVQRHSTSAKVLAVADMTRPSTEQRLFVIDLHAHKLLFRTWVAHGKNSGELYCTSVSNQSGSLQTSKGLYRVGERIVSPKHGDALLLHGLDKGINDKAEEREIIIHGADYVSPQFIAEHGRLGRSFGCPAVPEDRMPQLIQLFADGGLLYVHAK